MLNGQLGPQHLVAFLSDMLLSVVGLTPNHVQHISAGDMVINCPVVLSVLRVLDHSPCGHLRASCLNQLPQPWWLM